MKSTGVNIVLFLITFFSFVCFFAENDGAGTDPAELG